ncbi:UNKNOWN [Stylonychia lemnae]|uniref:Uncharacterized protein n=1 Tax=Stylonychia lemnae TaxID=5949 RepID=A0A078B8V9_STYLE|nr:UNKNOWN [Stylonychia lemnae]|eukprot:CDW90661.1 UNKNOWN [Stylonychia lemnae]
MNRQSIDTANDNKSLLKKRTYEQKDHLIMQEPNFQEITKSKNDAQIKGATNLLGKQKEDCFNLERGR